MWAPNEVYMASIHLKGDYREIRIYYGSINHINLRICKYFGLIKYLAKRINKLEYELHLIQ